MKLHFFFLALRILLLKNGTNKTATISWELNDEGPGPGTAPDEPSSFTSRAWAPRGQGVRNGPIPISGSLAFRKGAGMESPHWIFVETEGHAKMFTEEREGNRLFTVCLPRWVGNFMRAGPGAVSVNHWGPGTGLGAAVSVCDASVWVWTLSQMTTVCPSWTRFKQLLGGKGKILERVIT